MLKLPAQYPGSCPACLVRWLSESLQSATARRSPPLKAGPRQGLQRRGSALQAFPPGAASSPSCRVALAW